jgi:hypothetical protein
VTGYVQYIVYTAGNPVIAVGIAARTIASEVVAGISAVVSIDAALVITVNGTYLARPGGFDSEVALTSTDHLFAFRIQQHWLNTKERNRCRTGLEINRTR